jgi:hypothetical protein
LLHSSEVIRQISHHSKDALTATAALKSHTTVINHDGPVRSVHKEDERSRSARMGKDA